MRIERGKKMDFDRAIENLNEKADEIDIGDIELQDLIDDYRLAVKCLRVVKDLRDLIS